MLQLQNVFMSAAAAVQSFGLRSRNVQQRGVKHEGEKKKWETDTSQQIISDISFILFVVEMNWIS